MRFVLIILSLLLTIGLSAQKKELTLEAAILEGRTSFAPENISGLQWLPETEQYSYLKNDRSAMIVEGVGKKRVPITISKDVLIEEFSISLKRFPVVQWKTDQVFTFRHKDGIYEYNRGQQNGTMKYIIPESAENLDYNYRTNIAAFTRSGNVFVKSDKGAEIQITKFEKEDQIRAGEAIARYEFGIVKGLFWSPEGRKLAFYQTDESNVADYPLLDISTTPGSLNNIKYPMAGQASEMAKVGVYDIKKKQLVYLNVAGPKDQYLTNLGWGPDGNFIYLAVVNRDQNHVWLNKYDANSGALVKTLFEETHDKYVEPEHPVWFIPGNKNEFLWHSERDGYNHLYKYNVEGELIAQVTKGKWVVDEVLGLSASGNNIVVTGYDETGLNKCAYVCNMKNGSGKKLSDKSGQHRYKMHTNGILLIDQYSSMNTANAIDIISTRGKKITNLLAAKNPLDNYKIGTTELVELSAKDGTPLHARLIKPSFFNTNNVYPVVVYVYGGPHAQMVQNNRTGGARMWMYEMAERGFLVFTLDNRGSANRGFEFENVIHRNLGELEMEDQLVGVEYLKTLPFADTDRMAVHGWSYGGFMTTSLMLKKPGVFKAGVAGGPVTDWKWYEAMYGERYMDRPEENEAGYAKSTLLDKTSKLEGDLLLIHGTIDDVVLMQHNLALVQSFVNAGKQIDFFPYPMHPHNVRGKDRVHLMTKVLDYIEEKLGGGVTFGK